MECFSVFVESLHWLNYISYMITNFWRMLLRFSTLNTESNRASFYEKSLLNRKYIFRTNYKLFSKNFHRKCITFRLCSLKIKFQSFTYQNYPLHSTIQMNKNFVIKLYMYFFLFCVECTFKSKDTFYPFTFRRIDLMQMWTKQKWGQKNDRR